MPKPIDDMIFFETMAVLRRADPDEVREHIRRLTIFNCEKGGKEDIEAISRGEDAPGMAEPSREAMLERGENAADWLLESRDPLSTAQAGFLVMTLASKAFRHVLERR